MNVCIIGPVTTVSHTGGVSTFVEGLSDGFTSLGHNVMIITNYADKEYTEGGSYIKNLKSKTKIGFIFDSSHVLKENRFDLIIGSTWYDLALCLFARIKGKKIHYLHGFPVPCDGLVKAIMIAVNDKIHRKRCMLVSNSSFTKMVNEIFFGTKVDAVVPIGISPIFKKFLDTNSKDIQRSYDVIFVGRLRYNKGVHKIIEALYYIKEKYGVELSLVVVGNGEQFAQCKKIAEELQLNVTFVGKLDQVKTIEYYRNSGIFVSMDSKEPYGQTFVEALMCGCRIVCPASGGQLEYLLLYGDTACIAEPYSSASIGEAIYKQYQRDDSKISPEEIYKKHSYEKVATHIIELVN